MDDKPDRKNPETSDQLHPFVHIALAGLAFWLVMSAWLFFSQGGYIELDLAVVSALIFMIVAIPTLIHRIGERSEAGEQSRSVRRRWRDWTSGEFDMRQGRRNGVNASVEILLPMAAAVICITAIGIVFRLTEIGSYHL